MLTEEQRNDIERTQRVSRKIIFGEEYTHYEEMLQKIQLEKLEDRRKKRCLEFGLKALKHPQHRTMFPRNETKTNFTIRKREPFKVNKARRSYYANSTIPYIQRKMNSYFQT